MTFVYTIILQFRRFWQFLSRLAEGRGAVPAILSLSFFDSFLIVPPVEVPLAAFSAVTPKTWWKWALAGYGIGFFFFDTFGAAIVRLFGFESAFREAETVFEGSTFIAMLVAGLTPLPFVPFTYAGGFFSVGIIPFILGVVVARSIRYFAIAYAAAYLGFPFFRAVVRAMQSGTAITLIVLGGFFILLYFFAMHGIDF